MFNEMLPRAFLEELPEDLYGVMLFDIYIADRKNQHEVHVLFTVENLDYAHLYLVSSRKDRNNKLVQELAAHRRFTFSDGVPGDKGQAEFNKFLVTRVGKWLSPYFNKGYELVYVETQYRPHYYMSEGLQACFRRMSITEMLPLPSEKLEEFVVDYFEKPVFRKQPDPDPNSWTGVTYIPQKRKKPKKERKPQ
jgi:hypothetical protein